VIHQESADHVVLVTNATPYDSIGTEQEPCIIDPSRAQDKSLRLDRCSFAFRTPYFDRIQFGSSSIGSDLGGGRMQKNANIFVG
jgi:hypothetical protein